MIGGHGSMWGEKVDANNIFERTFPRASCGMFNTITIAIAITNIPTVSERLWSDIDFLNESESKTGRGEQLSNRLSIQRCRMVARGFPASPIEPGTCAFE